MWKAENASPITHLHKEHKGLLICTMLEFYDSMVFLQWTAVIFRPVRQ